jgi:hypothetical protein
MENAVIGRKEGNALEKGFSIFRLKTVSSSYEEWVRRIPFRGFVEYLLLAIIFFTCSVPYKINISSFSIFPIEIATFVYLIWRWVWGKKAAVPTLIRERNLLVGLVVLIGLSSVIWSISINWHDRTDLLWGWIFATLLFSAILDSARQREIDLRIMAILFVLCALPNAIVGLQQYWLGSIFPHKGWFGWDQNATMVPISGLFGYPNEMGNYQYWIFVLSIGFCFTTKRFYRLAFLFLSGLNLLILIFTISRSVLLGIICFIALLLYILLVRSRRQFLVFFSGSVLMITSAIVWILPKIPRQLLSNRVQLWQKTIQLIISDRYWLPFGILRELAKGRSAFWIPHNVFLFSWIYFGWGGILLLTALMIYLFMTGWKYYSQLRRNAIGLVLWVGLGSMILINGMATLYLHEVYDVITFIIILAFWAIAWRQIAISPD